MSFPVFVLNILYNDKFNLQKHFIKGLFASLGVNTVNTFEK